MSASANITGSFRPLSFVAVGAQLLGSEGIGDPSAASPPTAGGTYANVPAADADKVVATIVRRDSSVWRMVFAIGLMLFGIVLIFTGDRFYDGMSFAGYAFVLAGVSWLVTVGSRKDKNGDPESEPVGEKDF